MYAHLSGTITHLGVDHTVIDCHGVGYLVYCSGRTLGRLQAGHAAMLHTRLIVREDAMILYGFAEVAERDLFDLITTVSGVGPRLGISLLSSFTPEEIFNAVQTNQPSVLARASGVGKKLAEKIIVELKDKPAPFAALSSFTALPANSTAAHVVADLSSALINLGYQAKLAETAAAEAYKDALQETDTPPFELLFKKALQKVA